MNRRITISFVLTLSLLSNYAVAQNDFTKLLDKTISNYKNGIELEIAITMEDRNQDLMTEQNGLVKVKGDLFNMSLKGATTIFDGESMFMILEDSELYLICPDGSSSLMSLLLETRDHNTETSKSTEDGKSIISFTFESENKAVKTIRVFEESALIHSYQISFTNEGLSNLISVISQKDYEFKSEDFKVDPDNYDDTLDLREDCI